MISGPRKFRAISDEEVISLRAHSDQMSHASSLKSKTAKWVGALRIQEAGIATLALISFCATLGGTLWARVYSHYKHKSLFDGIEEAQIKSLSESLHIVLTGIHRGRRTEAPVQFSETFLKEGILRACRLLQKVSDRPAFLEKKIDPFLDGLSLQKEAKLAKNLARQVVQIREKIEQFSKGKLVSGGVSGLRKDLSIALDNPLYQALEAQDCAAVNFLQFVSIKLIGANGSIALRDYGRKCLGTLRGSAFHPVQLADLISNELKRFGFSYGWPYILPYIACHPLTSMHSVVSHSDPLGYNPLDNPHFSAHAFSLAKKKLIFYYGPGPTGNPIFEHGVLPAYNKFNVFELRFNFQDACKKSEFQRVRQIEEMGEEHPKVLRHALLGFDTKMENNSSVQFKDVDSFFASYRRYVKNGVRGQKSRHGHSGFNIPFHLLSDKGVDVALNKAQEFCRVLSVNNPHWEQAMQERGQGGFTKTLLSPLISHGQGSLHPGQARMAKMMQLVTDACLTLAMTYHSLDAITPAMLQKSLDKKLDNDLTAVRTSGACKQNVDRAVVENIALRLFFRWAHNPAPLSKEEVYEIAGVVFGRARLVDDRKIIAGRYEILDDLLRFVGSAPQGVEGAHALLKPFRQALSIS